MGSHANVEENHGAHFGLLLGSCSNVPDTGAIQFVLYKTVYTVVIGILYMADNSQHWYTWWAWLYVAHSVRHCYTSVHVGLPNLPT